MKIVRYIPIGLVTAILSILGAGCAGPNYATSPYHPGPALGRAVGTGVGVVGGNAVGSVVGFGEGAVSGAAAPFDNTIRVVRRWRTETTSDGRTVQVPEDILVDAYGRPVYAPAKTAPSEPLTSPKSQ